MLLDPGRQVIQVDAGQGLRLEGMMAWLRVGGVANILQLPLVLHAVRALVHQV